MGIKKKLQITIFASGGIAILVFGLILDWTSGQISEATDHANSMNMIVKGVSDLIILTNEYSSHHEERTQIQWQLRYNQLTEILAFVEFKDPHEREKLDHITQIHGDLRYLYSELVSNYEARGSNSEDIALSMDLEKRLIGQLAVQAQMMIDETFQLEKTVHERVEAVQRISILSLFAAGMIILFIMIVSIMSVSNNIVSRLSRLTDGAHIIAGGNLETQVIVENSDEIGSLAEAFNHMTSKLSMTYKDLKNEIIQREEAEVGLKQKTEEISRLYRASGAILPETNTNIKMLSKKIVETILNEFEKSNCSLFLIEPDSQIVNRIAVAGPYIDDVIDKSLILHGGGLVPKAIREKTILNIPNVNQRSEYLPNWGSAKSELVIPISLDNQIIGAIDLQSPELEAFSKEDERLMSLFSERVALSLENTRLFENANRRLQRINSLRKIDQAITSSFDLNIALNIVMGEVSSQLEVDAVDVLLYDSATYTLSFACGMGFRTAALQHTNLRLGEGYAGKAAYNREILHIANIEEEDDEDGFRKSPLLSREDFVTYYGVPLIAKGEIMGVLEVYFRSLTVTSKEWIEYLQTIAGQCAIVIDNASLFNDLQLSNLEIIQAYDETLEGWAKALELRDKESEGHARRVVDLTLRLARKLNLSQVDIVHLRRGALLHDIGKLGVPDEILHKPGPLNEDEWDVMRQHPVYAYNWLSSIRYLRPALDIPHYHHERWDGTGYPQGLQGEKIPLAARIFAVVDVWDALTSDRPYREAWPKEKVLEYIRDQSGIYFDPKIVELFLETINKEE